MPSTNAPPTRPDPFTRLVIRASAGSGKTYQLSARYLTLLLEGVPVDAILATTFTKKAAGEIQDRILARLGDAARTPENAAKLSEQLYGDPTAITQKRLRDLAVEVVRSLHRLRICTLDAFFMQIAGGFAFEIGLPPGWKIVDETDDARLLRSAIQASFAQSKTQNAVQLTRLLFKGDLRRSIESQISQVVDSALKIYYQTTADAWTRLNADRQTPTAQEFAQAVDDLENAPPPTNKSGSPNATFVKARAKIVGLAKAQDWPAFVGEKLVQTVASGDRVFARATFDDAVARPIERLLQFAERKIIADVASQTQATWIALDAISRFFEASKRDEAAFRFEDLSRILSRLQLANRFKQIVYRLDAKTSHLLLDEFQDASFEQWSILKPFAESIATRGTAPQISPKTPQKTPSLFDALDEADKPQPIETARLNAAADRGSFFCVGDVKQAIYGWRGGVAEIFNEIETAIPNVETAELTRNWRSCPTIIETVNRLFLPIRQNPVFQIDPELDPDSPQFRKKRALAKAVENWSARFTRHETAPSNADKLGYFALEVAPTVDPDGNVLPDFAEPPIDATGNFAPPSDDATDESATFSENAPLSETSLRGDVLDDFSGESDDDADGFGAPKFGEITQKQATLAYSVARIVRLRRQFPNATIGVLTRTNDLIVKLIAALKKQGVDASEEGGAPLTDAASVGAILSALVLASHPGDAVARFHLANVAPLSAHFDLTPQNFAEVGVGRRVSSRIRRRIETRGLGRFVAELADVLAPICEPRDKERLDKLVELAFRYQENETNVRVDRFIRTVRETKIESPSASTLRVMSLHKSKGLEFDVVVLPELDAPLDRLRESFVVRRATPTSPIDATIRTVSQDAQRFLPQGFQSIFEDALRAQIEEALCLLYVAVTRPVRALVAIISPKKEGARKSPTFANILRAGLAPNAAVFPDDDPRSRKAQILFETGDKNWDRNAPSPASETKSESSETRHFAPLTVETAKLASSAPSNRRLLLRRETPTGDRSSRRWNRPGAFALGTALHACFETVRWLDVDGLPSEERLRARLAPLTQNPADVRRAIRRFYEICETPFVSALLSRSKYETCDAIDATRSAVLLRPELEIADPSWDVLRERPFSTLAPDGKLWRGTIDRLVLLRDGNRVVGADVVDFKSDRLPNGVAPSQESLAVYRRQLAFYGEVVSRWYSLPKEKISLRLAFVSEGTAVDAAFPVAGGLDALAE